MFPNDDYLLLRLAQEIMQQRIQEKSVQRMLRQNQLSKDAQVLRLAYLCLYYLGQFLIKIGTRLEGLAETRLLQRIQVMGDAN